MTYLTTPERLLVKQTLTTLADLMDQSPSDSSLKTRLMIAVIIDKLDNVPKLLQ